MIPSFRYGIALFQYQKKKKREAYRHSDVYRHCFKYVIIPVHFIRIYVGHVRNNFGMKATESQLCATKPATITNSYTINLLHSLVAAPRATRFVACDLHLSFTVWYTYSFAWHHELGHRKRKKNISFSRLWRFMKQRNNHSYEKNHCCHGTNIQISEFNSFKVLNKIFFDELS